MKKLLFLILITAYSGQLSAQDKSAIELSGDILEYAMPSAAFISTFVWTDETKPHWQFVKSAGLAIGTAYILKSTVDKKRPDFNPNNPRYDSFPSGHTTSAFVSAAFMERRYGWKVGIPAYALAGWVGFSRVYAERHDWWDVLGGATIGTVSSYLFTKAYNNPNLNVGLNIAPEQCQIGLSYRF